MHVLALGDNVCVLNVFYAKYIMLLDHHVPNWGCNGKTYSNCLTPGDFVNEAHYIRL